MADPVGSSARFPALGGLAVVSVSDASVLAEAVAAAASIVDAFDRACSSFRSDSELACVNAAGGRPVQVSELFLDAVDAALRAARLTGGDVDPTVGEALVAYGFYDGSSPALARPRLSLARVPGYRAVALDRERSTLTLARGVRLDLGATAKALAADRAAAAAGAAARCGTLVSLSGDLAIAGPPPPDGWQVRVTDDHRSGLDAPGQTVVLQSGGLATSSTTVQRRDAGGVASHHVIDPSTGHPATVHFRTVSVAAGSCLDANIASTAAIIRGGRAVAWLQENRMPSRLVRLDGTVRHLSGWPADGEELPLASPVVLA
ncbi:MAG: FAD:protein FMN transferase [Solirubrobacteraceae bacterium]|jgi:thiamine biosynthesis lipoprotein